LRRYAAWSPSGRRASGPSGAWRGIRRPVRAARAVLPALPGASWVLVERLALRSVSLVVRRSGVRLPKAAPLFAQVKYYLADQRIARTRSQSLRPSCQTRRVAVTRRRGRGDGHLPTGRHVGLCHRFRHRTCAMRVQSIHVSQPSGQHDQRIAVLSGQGCAFARRRLRVEPDAKSAICQPHERHPAAPSSVRSASVQRPCHRLLWPSLGRAIAVCVA
jgi:hypothetical protein